MTLGVKQGLLEREAAEMMHNILEFKGTKVTEVMTPKVNIMKIAGEKTLKDVIEFIIKTPYSKYPVFSKDNKVIGILDVDDVLKYTKNNRLDKKVSSIVREAYFVPESKEIDDLLTEFEEKHMPLTVVVNEYGDPTGIVTVEDILEEIVGDIFDKSKRSSIYIKKISDKVMKIDAKIPIEELNKTLNLNLKDQHFDTLAGFIEHKLKRIPKKGEKITLKMAVIEIASVTKQKINSVKVIKV